ncbi:MAG: biotin synthase BioB [Flavobacteriales bacterium]|nr:biotin synthase BioB [Flavobacteriales bacterium]
MADIRYDWTKEEILEVYNLPLLELVHRASLIHRQHHDPLEVQVSSLLSIKTGGCVEDCAYCPQAARYHTEVEVHKLLPLKEVVESARNAKKGGASRFCMGAAWREVRDNSDFDKVLEMVREVNTLGMEVCCTLGMLTEEQARRLDEAGVYAYNHNIDTSEEHYGDIISTRTYEDRLDTIKNIRKTKMTVCSGGIIGMGESVDDRVGMLITLSSMNPHPESVPVNALVPIEGTPLADQPTVSSWEMIRMVATARIVIPEAAVRLSAGRGQMSKEAQAMCFMSGANSIFAGDKLLTTPNPEFNEDMQLFEDLGIKAKKPVLRKTSLKHSC